jgi:hypothetical protein
MDARRRRLRIHLIGAGARRHGVAGWRHARARGASLQHRRTRWAHHAPVAGRTPQYGARRAELQGLTATTSGMDARRRRSRRGTIVSEHVRGRRRPGSGARARRRPAFAGTLIPRPRGRRAPCAQEALRAAPPARVPAASLVGRFAVRRDPSCNDWVSAARTICGRRGTRVHPSQVSRRPGRCHRARRPTDRCPRAIAHPNAPRFVSVVGDAVNPRGFVVAPARVGRRTVRDAGCRVASRPTTVSAKDKKVAVRQRGCATGDRDRACRRPRG